MAASSDFARIASFVRLVINDALLPGMSGVHPGRCPANRFFDSLTHTYSEGFLMTSPMSFSF
jgi:hypothetical protein